MRETNVCALLLLCFGVCVISEQNEIVRAYSELKQNITHAQSILKNAQHALEDFVSNTEPDLRIKLTEVDKQHEARTSASQPIRKVKVIPEGMEDIYKFLRKLDALKRMKSWTMESTTDQRDIIDIKVPLDTDIKALDFENGLIKLVKDTPRDLLVCSYTCNIKERFPLATFAVNLRHNGTARLKLYPNTCGKGLCFFSTFDADNNNHLIITQKLSLISDPIFLIDIAFEISINQADTVIVRIERGDFMPTKMIDVKVYTKKIPSFKMAYTHSPRIEYDEKNEDTKIQIISNLTTTEPWLNDTHLLQFLIANQTKLFLLNPVVGTFENKNVLANMIVDLRNLSVVDGQIYSKFTLKNVDVERWTVQIQRHFLVYPNTKPGPKILGEKFIKAETDMNLTVEAHSSICFQYMIYGYTEGSVTWKKNINGVLYPHDPEFHLTLVKSTNKTEVIITNYDVKPAHSGVYVISVDAPDFHPLSAEVQVFEKRLRVESFNKTEYDDPIENNYVEITCNVSGEPRPKIEFYRQIVTDENYIIEEKYPKLEADDIFEFGQSTYENGITSRKLVIHEFPTNESHVFTTVCRATNEFQSVYMTRHVYNWDFE